MTGSRFRTVTLRAAVTAALLVLASCRGASVEQVETEAPVPVVVETAKVDVIRAVIQATGVVTPAPGGELTVVAPEAARVVSIPKAEGDVVKAGDLLVQFEIPTLAADLAARRSAVAQASARLEAATSNLNRLKSLLSQGVAAPREVEDATRQQAEATAELEQARSAVDAAAALAARTTVHATFPGIVAKRFHNPGDFVEPAASDPVLRVINPAQLQVVASVPVADLSRIAVGHSAEIRQPGREDLELMRVATKAAQVDQLFKERAYWLFLTSHRLGDMRRLIRQYNRPANTVFPTGAYFKGGTYGTDVSSPVPQREQNNPSYDPAACKLDQA